MQVSFMVVTYRRGELLQQCLDSIYAQEGLLRPFEVIVIDNSGDAAVPPAPDGISLRVERPHQNLGVAGGRNLGMELATGDYLVFIDDDACWHRTDDVARLIHHFTNDPRCAAVGVRSLSQDGALIISELPHPQKIRLQRAEDTVPAPYYYGVGHALRAEAVRHVGLYPQRYFYAGEEVDLSLRLIDAQWVVLFDPQVAVYHFRSNLGRLVVGARYWRDNAINKSRVAFRLLPFPYPWTTLAVWSAATLLKTGDPRLVFQVWRMLWGERRLLAEERRPIRPATVRYLKRIGARLWY